MNQLGYDIRQDCLKSFSAGKVGDFPEVDESLFNLFVVDRFSFAFDFSFGLNLNGFKRSDIDFFPVMT